MTWQRVLPQPTPASTAARPGVVLACTSVCTVLVIGFVASINLAVPMLAASSLHPSSGQLLWIVDAYVALFACLVIPAGAAGDRYGRKGTLLCGLVLFAAGATVSAAANDVVVMLLGRAVTGVGAACVLPNSLALLIHATPAARRTQAIATWAAISSIGGVIGNVGGGALLATGSWRWLFAAVVPIALACAAWVARAAPRTDRHSHDLDPVAAVLLTLATLALLMGIIEAPERGWGDVVVLGGFGTSVVLFGAWAVVELRSRRPLLNPRLFGIPVLRAASVGMLVMFLGSYGLFYLNASLLQYGRGYTPLQAGLGIIPLTVSLPIAGRYVPALVNRIGVAATLAAAFVVTSIGLFGLAATVDDPYPLYAFWLLVFGTGLALGVPCLTAEITTALPHEEAGVGAGLQSTTRELGSALGVAVIGTIANSYFLERLPRHLPHTVVDALAVVGSGQHRAVIDAFTSSSATALRIAGLIVLVTGVLVTAQILWADRRVQCKR